MYNTIMITLRESFLKIVQRAIPRTKMGKTQLHYQKGRMVGTGKNPAYLSKTNISSFFDI